MGKWFAGLNGGGMRTGLPHVVIKLAERKRVWENLEHRNLVVGCLETASHVVQVGFELTS